MTLSGATTISQSGPASDGNEGSNLHSLKLLHYWSLTIRWFNVISGHSMEDPYPLAENQSVYSTAPVEWAQ